MDTEINGEAPPKVQEQTNKGGQELITRGLDKMMSGMSMNTEDRINRMLSS